jgi:hypothetical protein
MVPGSLLTDLENGKISHITLELVADIADAVGVSVSDLTMGIPKAIVNRDIFDSNVKEIVPGVEYKVRAGKVYYIVTIDTKTWSDSDISPDAKVCDLKGDELPYGSLYNAVRNMVYEMITRRSRKKRTKHGGMYAR